MEQEFPGNYHEELGGANSLSLTEIFWQLQELDSTAAEQVYTNNEDARAVRLSFAAPRLSPALSSPDNSTFQQLANVVALPNGRLLGVVYVWGEHLNDEHCIISELAPGGEPVRVAGVMQPGYVNGFRDSTNTWRTQFSVLPDNRGITIEHTGVGESVVIGASSNELEHWLELSYDLWAPHFEEVAAYTTKFVGGVREDA